LVARRTLMDVERNILIYYTNLKDSTYGPSKKKERAVSSCTPTFFFLHPHNIMQRPNCPYYFLKTLKCT